jgi:hypothetical protein
MKEELVSFEVAKLAKEVGFNTIVDKYWCNYYTGEPLNKWKLLPHKALTINWMEFPAPTKSLLQRFIRESLGIHIVISPSWCEGESEASFFYELYNRDIQEEVFLNEDDKYNHGSTLYFASYEEALEDALKNSMLYAKKLNLIK